VSRQTAYRWSNRLAAKGDAGLEDRSSRPRRYPHRTKASVEYKIFKLRRRHKLGPDRIGPIVGVPPSTGHPVPVRHGLNPLTWMDRPTGRVIRRMHHTRLGELVHVDVKKLGQIPPEAGGERYEEPPRSALLPICLAIYS
jgi:hypothetical protein